MKDLNLSGSATFFFKNEIPYAAIPKEYLKDKNLSLKAKGLLTIIYTIPEKWEYNMNGLAKITGKSLKVIRPILAELERNYYISRERKQDEKGRFYYEYIIDIKKNGIIYSIKEEPYTIL